MSLVFAQSSDVDCSAKLLLVTSEKHSNYVFGVYSDLQENEESWASCFICV